MIAYNPQMGEGTFDKKHKENSNVRVIYGK
jgi:hypothetical protein